MALDHPDLGLDLTETPSPTQPVPPQVAKDSDMVPIQGFLIGQKADKMGRSLVSQDRRPVLREFRSSERYKELTTDQNAPRNESISCAPKLKALRMLREAGRGAGAPVSPHVRASAMRILAEDGVSSGNMFRALNGHPMIVEDDQSEATSLMVALIEGGYDRDLIEVELSPSDKSVYVYIDEKAEERLKSILALLEQWGDVNLISRPEDDRALGAFVIRVKEKQENAKQTPDVPLDNAECASCKSESVFLTSEYGAMLRCAACGTASLLNETESRKLFSIIEGDDWPWPDGLSREEYHLQAVERKAARLGIPKSCTCQICAKNDELKKKDSLARWNRDQRGKDESEETDDKYDPEYTPEKVQAIFKRMAPEKCAGCGEKWPCSDSKRKDIRGVERAKHYVKSEEKAEGRVEFGHASKIARDHPDSHFFYRRDHKTKGGVEDRTFDTNAEFLKYMKSVGPLDPDEDHEYGVDNRSDVARHRGKDEARSSVSGADLDKEATGILMDIYAASKAGDSEKLNQLFVRASDKGIRDDAKAANRKGLEARRASSSKAESAGPHLTLKKVDGEWQVQWIENGRVNPSKTYYTDDKADAEATMADMQARMDKGGKGESEISVDDLLLVSDSNELLKVVAVADDKVTLEGFSYASRTSSCVPVQQLKDVLESKAQTRVGNLSASGDPVRVVFESQAKVNRVQEWYRALPLDRKTADLFEILQNEKGKLRRFAVTLSRKSLQDSCRHLTSVFQAKFLEVNGLQKPASESKVEVPVAKSNRMFVFFGEDISETKERARVFSEATQLKPVVVDAKGRYGFVIDIPMLRQLESYIRMFNGSVVDEPAELVKAEAENPEDAPTGAFADDESNIQQFRKIVADKTMGEVDGHPVDLFSASAVVSIYDALSPENQKKYAVMDVQKMMNVAYKIMHDQTPKTEADFAPGPDPSMTEVPPAGMPLDPSMNPPVDPQLDPNAQDPAVQADDANLVDDVIREVRAGLYGEWPPISEDPSETGEPTITSEDIRLQLSKAMTAHGIEGPRRTNTQLWSEAFQSLLQFAKIDTKHSLGTDSPEPPPEASMTQPGTQEPPAVPESLSDSVKADFLLTAFDLAKHAEASRLRNIQGMTERAEAHLLDILKESEASGLGQATKAAIEQGRVAAHKALTEGPMSPPPFASGYQQSPPKAPRSRSPRIVARPNAPTFAGTLAKKGLAALGRGALKVGNVATLGLGGLAAKGVQAGARLVRNTSQEVSLGRMDANTMKQSVDMAKIWHTGPNSVLAKFAQAGKLTTADEAAQAMNEIGSMQEIVQQHRSTGQVDQKTADADLNQLNFLFKFFRELATGAAGVQGGMAQGAARYMYPESSESGNGVPHGGERAPSTAGTPTSAPETESDQTATTSLTSSVRDASDPIAEAKREYERRKQVIEDAVLGIVRPKEESGPSSAAAANSKLKACDVHNFEFSDQAWEEFEGLVANGTLPMNIAVHFGLPIGTVEQLLDLPFGSTGGDEKA